MFTIINTLPEFYWLTNYIETSISAEVWKTCTTATIAYEYKRLMLEYAEKTGAPLDYAEDYYGAEGVIGVSVPATEHSVMCMGTQDAEIDTFRRLISELYPKGVVSIVSDTWDFWRSSQNTLCN